jgi:hypothetical protein
LRLELPGAEEALPRVLTEQELAEWRREQGYRVSRARGRWWSQNVRGFYQGMHYLARFRADEARRPAALCWAYRAALAPEDSQAANSTWPVCILPRLSDYDDSALRRSVRQDLNKSRRRVNIVWLNEPTLLREQGYEVYLAGSKKVGRAKTKSREKYLAGVDGFVRDRRRLVLAGVVGDRLVGYCDSFAVDGTAYGWNIYVHPDFYSANVHMGLQFETWQAYRRTGYVMQAVNGLHTPEQPGLMAYKERLGFQVVRVPAVLAMPAPVLLLLRKRRPWVHYRLTGQDATHGPKDRRVASERSGETR